MLTDLAERLRWLREELRMIEARPVYALEKAELWRAVWRLVDLVEAHQLAIAELAKRART